MLKTTKPRKKIRPTPRVHLPGYLRCLVLRHSWRSVEVLYALDIEIWECIYCRRLDVRKASEVF